MTILGSKLEAMEEYAYSTVNTNTGKNIFLINIKQLYIYRILAFYRFYNSY
jgi:hypothetical protein